MSKISNLMLQAAAGQAGGAGLDITDVFSTYLYEGTGSTSNTITNGIDLAGEGGMIWAKARNGSFKHAVADTERGIEWTLHTNESSADREYPGFYGVVSSYNSDGFTLNADTSGAYFFNGPYEYASWTFRKAPKFFDVVTYTGTGSSNEVSHSLEAVPAWVIIKSTSDSNDWKVYARTGDVGSGYYYSLFYTSGAMNSAADADANNINLSAAITDTVVNVNTLNGGASPNDTNISGRSYVMYLFAHNDGDGDFGPDGDQDIIKCGSYTGNGSADGPEIDLGFEPQWVMVKRADAGSEHWAIIDSMRKMTSGESNNALMLKPNNSEAEEGVGFADPLPTGFKLSRNEGVTNASGGTYIYIAIRRGPLAPPESGTEVFSMDMNGTSNNHYDANHVVDFAFYKSKDNAYDWNVNSRLTQGKSLKFNNTNAESSNTLAQFDVQNGWADSAALTSEYPTWMWRRAPNFFDVVAYTGDGTYPRNIAHNLGATPEMVIVKARNWASGNWATHHKDLGYSTVSYLDNTLGSASQPHFLTASDASTFTVGSATSFSNYSNSASYTYIAYLFATLPGVSKVGSYTGNGSSQTIDCGFTSGARFILIRRTDSTGDWYVWDTERGIVAGDDPHLSLNTTAAEVTSDDSIDPDNSGFIVNQVSATNINVSSASYIFYAIA